jgi:fumarate hydratase subunit alpha
LTRLQLKWYHFIEVIILREIDAEQITRAIKLLFLKACCHLPREAGAALEKALGTEDSPSGRAIINQLLKNKELSYGLNRPYCQDTGMAVVFAEIGQDVHINGDFKDAVNEGVRRAYAAGFLRKSCLGALSRVNTGDNTPAVIHIDLVPGDKIKLTAAPKGFGSENMSRLYMLTPADGIEGVKRAVIETVRCAGANPCPPVVVGVGIGGTMELAALMAKRQLIRPLGEPSADSELAALEKELLEKLNDLGIGPMGLGGRTTALAVHIAQFPTHLAGLPVAINMQCHAARHAEMIL